MKTVLLYTGIFVVGFIVLLAGAYIAYPHLHPKVVAKVQQEVDNKELPPIYDYTKFSPLKFDTLTTEVSKLKKQIQLYKSVPDKNKLLIDSLVKVRKLQKKVITQLRDSLDLQKKQLIADRKTKTKQKVTGLQYSDVGKSLLSMDPSALAPILKKLNDNMLVGLYRDGSNMQREKLLQSLDPNRAAELLKKVTQ
ncbi:MAG TPA: hypothetical protein VKA08_10000 [Balneolales bacterium]|nr:hypothetical protein [Balneolales bacterium]